MLRAALVVFLFGSASAATIPVVGCPSDGQTGPVEAPPGGSVEVALAPKGAAALSYYRSSWPIPVLAPRGWHCFATYGSAGVNLYIAPQPIDAQHWKKFTGPAIQASRLSGDTSGRMAVARAIARVFPARRDFVDRVLRDFEDHELSFPWGPYPADKLAYKGSNLVEYTTPGGNEGLGTQTWLEKNRDPIRGVAILSGEAPDLLHLAVRLPRDLDGLTPAIVAQFERDAK